MRPRPPLAAPPPTTSRARALQTAVAAVVSMFAPAGCGRDEPVPPRTSPPPTLAPKATDTGERLGPYPRSQFYIQRDLFLAADEPATVPAADARFLGDDDEVLGFVIREKARAYAVTMLSYHHVVNDVVAGIPVAVTY